MKQFEGITDAADAVNEWFWSSKNNLHEKIVEVIQPLLGPTKSAVDLVVKTTEVIYANRDQVDAAALELAAGLASFCNMWGFHGLDVDNRGQNMSLAMRRDSGEKAPVGVKWPKAEEDPDLKPELAINKETEVSETPAPVPAEG